MPRKITCAQLDASKRAANGIAAAVKEVYTLKPEPVYGSCVFRSAVVCSLGRPTRTTHLAPACRRL